MQTFMRHPSFARYSCVTYLTFTLSQKCCWSLWRGMQYLTSFEFVQP